MAERRVAVYGGIDLDRPTQAFVHDLAQALLAAEPAVVLLTGGYRKRRDHRGWVSTDRQVVEGAEAALGPAAAGRLRALVPDRSRDRDDAIRYRPRDTVGTIEVLDGVTARQRRLRLVAAAEALITVKGHVHTAMVLDAALAVGVPFLPLPFTGGDSREYWTECRDRVCRWFGITEADALRLEAVDLGRCTAAERRGLADRVAALVMAATRRVCLLAVPFHDQYRPFHEAVVGPAIRAAGFEARRLDEVAYTGRVLAEFLRGLRDSDRVLADLTDYSPNVLYEVGCAHALGVSPFLVDATPAGARPDWALPFYLRDQVVYRDDGTEAGRGRLRDTIRAWLAGRPGPGPGPGS